MSPLDTILQGDCTNVMRRLPSESVDFCLTDPPKWGQVEDTCKKWSQGRRLGGAGAFGDFSDYPPARTTATLLRI